MALDDHMGASPSSVALQLSPPSYSVKPRSTGLPVTIVIPTLNEAARIGNSVAALDWVNEVVVVDGGSTDGTPELAAGAGATVIRFPGHTIAGQRNAGIAIARNDWILALDVDENVPLSLQDELKSVLASPRHAAYRIRFLNNFLGGDLHHGRWGRDWHVRLFRRDLRFVEKRVHENLQSVPDLGSLHSPLLHTPYRDINHLFQKMIQYAHWGAEDLYERGRRANPFDLTLVPAWRFLREYVMYSGWRDGSRGLLAAAMNASAGLMKYACLYALQWQSSKPACAPQK